MAETVYKQVAIRSSQQEMEAGSLWRGFNRNLHFVALIVALTFIGGSLFSVWARHQVISLGYQISQASQEEQGLLGENNKLRLELAALKSPQRIENIALKELGFAAPQKEQLIIVR